MTHKVPLRRTEHSQECDTCHKLKRFNTFQNYRGKKKGKSTTCKPCSKKAREVILSRRKKKDWIKWKASSLRSSWMSRAKRYEDVDRSTIPTTTEIRHWLKEQQPYICYLTDAVLDRDKMEADHKQPISKGGTFDLNNIGFTSKDTNLLKADLLEEDFLSLLKLVKEWEDKGDSLFNLLRKSRSTWR